MNYISNAIKYIPESGRILALVQLIKGDQEKHEAEEVDQE